MYSFNEKVVLLNYEFFLAFTVQNDQNPFHLEVSSGLSFIETKKCISRDAMKRIIGLDQYKSPGLYSLI